MLLSRTLLLFLSSTLIACGGGGSSAAPGAALTPTFATPTATANGFTAQISNFDASYTYAGTATASGVVAISGSGLVTVTGVAALTSSTATITTAKTNTLSGSAQVSERSSIVFTNRTTADGL